MLERNHSMVVVDLVALEPVEVQQMLLVKALTLEEVLEVDSLVRLRMPHRKVLI